jgi:hypothetical protein
MVKVSLLLKESGWDAAGLSAALSGKAFVADVQAELSYP